MADRRSAFAAQAAANVATQYAGVGTVAVTRGATTVYGFADRQRLDEADAQGFPVTGPPPVLLCVVAGALGAFVRDATVTIAAGALAGTYRLRAHATSDDGAEDYFTLREDGA